MTFIIDTLTPAERAAQRLRDGRQTPDKAREYRNAYRDARRHMLELWGLLEAQAKAHQRGDRYSHKQGREIHDRLQDAIASVLWADQCCCNADGE